MSQEEFISWAVIIIGLIISLAGIAWGVFSLFKMTRQDDGNIDFEFTPLLIAAFAVYAGIQVMVWGYKFPVGN